MDWIIPGLQKALGYKSAEKLYRLDRDVNAKPLQRMMGHNDLKTTMGYVHTSTQALMDAMESRFSADIPVKKESNI